MILADKIINERKKNGWSQEELAQHLSVTRQSVSKWEGAQAVPDIQKIIAMADLFGVSTDYLLKDELELDSINTEIVIREDNSAYSDFRKVTLEEASEYLDITRKNAPKIANAVSLCILSPALLIFMLGLSEMQGSFITENMAVAIGIIVLLALVAIAVFTFIVCGSRRNKYEYIEKEPIETAYGVSGMVQARKDAIEESKNVLTAVGVVMCIASVIPLIITSCLQMANYIVVAMVCVLLIIVAAAVNIIIRANSEWNCCKELLQEGDYTVKNKDMNKIIEKISGIYWSVIVAIYLSWSFISGRWDLSWIVWPIAGVVFGAVSAVVRTFEREK